MITKDTVLILGAGASVPFGFPSGQILTDIILHFFSFAHKGYVVPGTTAWLNETMKVKMYGMLKETFPEYDINDFMEHLNGEESIDAFLEHQNEVFVNIGKAVIAAALLPFEKKKDLDWRFMERRLLSFVGRESTGPKYNWYQLLWRALNAKFDDFQKNRLKIITFNYDRSLEHYLFTRLKRRYPGIDKDVEYAAKMPKIAHVHGRLGLLPWQIRTDKERHQAVPYGVMEKVKSPIETDDEFKVKVEMWFRAAMSQITVIHENIDSPELEEPRKWIQDCERLYFLGFGYHKSNLDRLKIESAGENKKEIMGTTLGLSHERWQYALKVIARLKPMNYKVQAYKQELAKVLPNCDVYTFLHDHVDLTSS